MTFATQISPLLILIFVYYKKLVKITKGYFSKLCIYVSYVSFYFKTVNFESALVEMIILYPLELFT